MTHQIISSKAGLYDHMPISWVVENDHNYTFDNANMNCLSVNVCNKHTNPTHTKKQSNY